MGPSPSAASLKTTRYLIAADQPFPRIVCSDRTVVIVSDVYPPGTQRRDILSVIAVPPQGIDEYELDLPDGIERLRRHRHVLHPFVNPPESQLCHNARTAPRVPGIRWVLLSPPLFRQASVPNPVTKYHWRSWTRTCSPAAARVREIQHQFTLVFSVTPYPDSVDIMRVCSAVTQTPHFHSPPVTSSEQHAIQPGSNCLWYPLLAVTFVNRLKDHLEKSYSPGMQEGNRTGQGPHTIRALLAAAVCNRSLGQSGKAIPQVKEALVICDDFQDPSSHGHCHLTLATFSAQDASLLGSRDQSLRPLTQVRDHVRDVEPINLFLGQSRHLVLFPKLEELTLHHSEDPGRTGRTKTRPPDSTTSYSARSLLRRRSKLSNSGRRTSIIPACGR